MPQKGYADYIEQRHLYVVNQFILALNIILIIKKLILS